MLDFSTLNTDSAADIYNSSEPLFSLFPITLVNKEVRNFSCKCMRCGDTINPANVRGQAEKLLKNVLKINAIAYCKECNVLNTFANYRIREDNDNLYLQTQLPGSEWVTIPLEAERTLLDRLFGK